LLKASIPFTRSLFPSAKITLKTLAYKGFAIKLTKSHSEQNVQVSSSVCQELSGKSARHSPAIPAALAAIGCGHALRGAMCQR
jgi:hypothetical protein